MDVNKARHRKEKTARVIKFPVVNLLCVMFYFQIIRIHNIFKQRRVKAELVHGHGADPEGYQISIPLDYKAKFFEVKHLDFHKRKFKVRTLVQQCTII